TAKAAASSWPSSRCLPAEPAAAPAGGRRGEAALGHGERVRALAQLEIAVVARPALAIVGVDVDAEGHEALAVVVAGAQHDGGRARVGADERDLAHGRADGLAELGAE